MKPHLYSRDDLLDDPRFWALLYETHVKPQIGDDFHDGEEHFFSVPEAAVNAFFHQLEQLPVGANRYPEVSVCVSLRNRWRAGVILSFFPEDFAIQDVLVPPEGSHAVIGVNGGNSKLPALRWDELQIIADNVVVQGVGSPARLVLLLFPSVCPGKDVSPTEVRSVLHRCLCESGLPIRHLDEFLDRLLEGPPDDSIWRQHPRYGWSNDGRHSLRNPQNKGASEALLLIRQLFSSIA